MRSKMFRVTYLDGSYQDFDTAEEAIKVWIRDQYNGADEAFKVI